MIGTDLVLLGEEYLMSMELYKKAIDRVKDFIGKSGPMAIADFRDMMGSSRKISMLILENFDKEKITKRVENKRVLY